MKKPIVLLLVGHYLPGYKAGGPIQTISNLVHHLGDSYDFRVITLNHDLGDSTPYDVPLNTWVPKGGYFVKYIEKSNAIGLSFLKILRNEEYSILYVNSFFDFRFSIQVALFNFLGVLNGAPLLLAPRGEFSRGAISIKSIKKKAYFILSKLLGIYNKVYFQASTDFEKNDIISNFNISAEYLKVATDLPSASLNFDDDACIGSSDPMRANFLNLVFLSRISKMKNLDYILNVLSTIRRNIIFDIYGPIEDEEYWLSCVSLIEGLPENVQVSYLGPLAPEAVKKTIARYDLFFLPSLGENYCHAIAESLSVGTPTLISDRTPWRKLESLGLGWDISLDSFDEFSHVITSFDLNNRRSIHSRYDARKRFEALLSLPSGILANKSLFNSIIYKNSIIGSNTEVTK